MTHEYPPGEHGGIGSFTQTLARKLYKNGHKITIIGNYPVKSMTFENDMGVRVIRIPLSSIPKTGILINGLRMTNILREIHEKEKIDIIEAPNLGLGLISNSLTATKIMRIHSTISTEKKIKLVRLWQIRRALRNADYICAVSNFSAESSRKRLKIEKHDIEVIYNPIDTTIFSPQAIENIQKGLILFVGTVCENKGVRQLVQAMPEIIKKIPSAHLLIVGRDWYDYKSGKSYTANLRRFISSDLKKHIEFKGSIEHSQIPKIISSANVCVYPSHMENMPVAWLEGMAMGKSIVASNTGPGPEVIEDGVSGLLCDPFNPHSIAEKIIKILKYPEMSYDLGRQARKRAVELFGIDSLAKKNEVFYDACIKKRGIRIK